MFHGLQIVTVLIVAVVLAMSLAHVLEYPGKLRLDRDAYFAVQTIYYLPASTSPASASR